MGSEPDSGRQRYRLFSHPQVGRQLDKQTTGKLGPSVNNISLYVIQLRFNQTWGSSKTNRYFCRHQPGLRPWAKGGQSKGNDQRSSGYAPR